MNEEVMASDQLHKAVKGEEEQPRSMLWNDERLDDILSDMRSHRLVGPTGLTNLDELLDGGLYPEVYVLGAEPGTGKTTLALQIADRLAQFGDRRVLFFSQEMSVGQVVSKSISAVASRVCGNPIYVRSIQNPKRLDKELLADCQKAIEHYRVEVAPFIATIDGHVNVADIRERIEEVLDDERNDSGFAPIVFVDYLQIMKPKNEDGNRTDTQLYGESMRGLIDLSIRYKTPVFIIASKNRANRNSKNLEAFAGSSFIEYGASVAMLMSVDGDEEEKAANLKQPVRPVTLSVIKNRNGRLGDVQLYFNAPENKFIEAVESGF